MIDEENGQTRKTKGGKRYQKKQKGKKGKRSCEELWEKAGR